MAFTNTALTLDCSTDVRSHLHQKLRRSFKHGSELIAVLLRMNLIGQFHQNDGVVAHNADQQHGTNNHRCADRSLSDKQTHNAACQRHDTTNVITSIDVSMLSICRVQPRKIS